MTASANLNPSQVFTFLEVIRSGSVSGAARNLLIGQPAVSMQLRALESSLGAPLFRREGKRLVLTEAGEVLRRHAFKLSEWKEQLLSDLQSETGYRRNRLRVGFLDGISKSLIVRLSTELMSLRKDLHLYLAEGRGPALVQDLRDRALDAVLLNYSPESSALSGLRAAKMASLEVGLFVRGKRASLGSKAAINRTLCAEPLILPTYDSRLRGELDRYFLENRITINARVEVQDTAVQKLLALQGLGIALLPLTGQNLGIPREATLHLLARLPGVHEDIWLLTREDPSNPELDALLWSLRLGD